jgi:hypothetical protein
MSITTTSGRRLLGQTDRLGAVAGLGHHRHPGLGESVAEDASQQGVVLRDQDPDRLAHVSA